jgi:hypothetical protein
LRNLVHVVNISAWLVVGQVAPFNLAASVRGPRHVVKKGKTPMLAPDEARQLIDTIDVTTSPW